MSEGKNVYQRVNEIRKKVSYIKKDKKVEGYTAVTHDNVTRLIREHLVNNGVLIIPVQTFSAVVDTGKTTKSGTPYIRFDGHYNFIVQNVDDPEDNFIGSIHAHAEDHGDKAPGKAVSYAMKAFELKLFNIESGEDDEDRPEQEPEKLSEDQLINLREICESYEWDVDNMLLRIAGSYGAKSISEVQAKWFDSIQKRMAKTREKELEAK